MKDIRLVTGFLAFWIVLKLDVPVIAPSANDKEHQ